MPHHFPTSWRYSKWDGSGEAALDPDDVFDSLSEDLLRDGNLDQALRRAFHWGMRNPDGGHTDGLRDLADRMRQRRQEMLDKYDFDSVTGELAERLQDIIDREKSTLDERLQQDQNSSGADSGDQDALRDYLQKKQDKLDALPDDPAGQIQQLQDHDFVNRQAGEDFEQLMDQLRQQITDSLFNNLMGAASGQNGSPEELKDFLQDLNEAFEQDANGQPVDMDRLNNKWSHMFGGRADNMQQIAERMQQRMAAGQMLMSMLSPEQREQLQQTMQQMMQDMGIEDELAKLQQNLGPMPPQPGMEQSPMHGDEQLSLDMATRMLQQASEMEQAEQELRQAMEPGDLQGIPREMLDKVLDEQDREWLDNWTQMEDQLVDQGYATRGRKGLELTPKAIRKIGEKALEDIFSSLKDLGSGEHDIHETGAIGESAETSAPWKFGDPFTLDLPRTVMNGISGRGPGTPVKLRPDDFEVIEREARTSTATALLIDMSRSMYYSGSWDAAKRAALALDTLIRGKYPRDMLELIGFSSIAQRLQMTDLPTLNWNEYTYGTNLQHALELARQRLRSERGRNRQIIVVTDGEPTAYMENGRVQFNYPPTWETFEATIREVVRCTREHIVINVFLLEQSPWMSRFVEDLMRINHGRVINASPTRLGGYVLKDFLQQRTLWRA